MRRKRPSPSGPRSAAPRRRGLVLALAAAVALTAVPAAASAPVLPLDEPSDAPPIWVPPDPSPLVAPSETYEPSDEAHCRAGILVCVDNMIREMERHLHELGCDHNAVFALLYLRTTEGIRDAIADGVFDDRHFLAHEAYVFGRYYLDPFDAWERGHDDRVPGAWRIAFEAADAQEVGVLGNMFLGINAHVNRDLPFVLAAIGLTDRDGDSREADHDRVNDVLAATRPVAVPQISALLDPTVFAAFEDEAFLASPFSDPALVPVWREAAWENAERLTAAASEEELAAVAAEIEAEAEEIAEEIVEVFAYTGDEEPPQPATRDSHCEAALGG